MSAAGSGADAAAIHRAAQVLEALVLKHLVTASHAFTGGEGAGSAVRAGLFADALADAMVKGGGIDLARSIERGLGTAAGPAGAGTPVTPPRSTALAPSPMELASPVDSTAPVVTSPFGLREDPFDGHLARHEGVDLAGAEGALVRAVAGGVVRRAGARGGYGSAVEIDHGDGVTTIYAHASELLVHDGERVTQGQPIARVGHTGRATGAHLHFEVRVGNTPVPPSRALKIYGLRAEDIDGSGS